MKEVMEVMMVDVIQDPLVTFEIMEGLLCKGAWNPGICCVMGCAGGWFYGAQVLKGSRLPVTVE